MKNLSIRARLILIVVLAALPTVAVTLYGTWEERGRAIAVARKDLQRVATLAAEQQEQIIEGAKQALVAISLIPNVMRNDSARCNEYLAALLAKSAGLYHSVGIYGADGVLQCNAIPWEGKVYSPDRLYFSLARATGKFSVGEYQVGRVTKKQGINLGYPVVDARGTVTGVAFIALDLESLNKVAATVPLPERGELTVIDRDGVVLAHSPPKAGAIGNKFPSPHILSAVLIGRAGEFFSKGSGNIDRLVVFSTVTENPDGGIPIRVIVSVPVSVILADANQTMLRELGGILIATALLLIAGWYGTQVFVLRTIRILLGVARDVQAGRFGARTRLAHDKDELSQLGAALDSMASALQQRDADLQRALQDLEQQATTDPLTGLHNRRFLYDTLPRELARAQRATAHVAVIMIDIDHFKRINDTYGHDMGDRVLKEVARLIKATIRSSDLSCRYGGEEIALALMDAPLEGARLRAEAIRTAVEKLEVDRPGEKPVNVTVSLGVAVFPDHGADAQSLLRAADEALYEAKGAGRNRVVTCR